MVPHELQADLDGTAHYWVVHLEPHFGSKGISPG